MNKFTFYPIFVVFAQSFEQRIAASNLLFLYTYYHVLFLFEFSLENKYYWYNFTIQIGRAHV